MLVHPSFVGSTWALRDLGGRMVLSGRFSSGNDRILIGALPAGVYLFQGPQGTQRVVIQR